MNRVFQSAAWHWGDRSAWLREVQEVILQNQSFGVVWPCNNHARGVRRGTDTHSACGNSCNRSKIPQAEWWKVWNTRGFSFAAKLFVYEASGRRYTDIFFTWAKHIVNETNYLRRDCKKILFVTYGYSAHLSYKTLTMLRDNGVIVVGFPSFNNWT